MTRLTEPHTTIFSIFTHFTQCGQRLNFFTMLRKSQYIAYMVKGICCAQLLPIVIG